jgi:hypothetical protein
MWYGNVLLAPIYTKNHHFTKTGSGQTWGKLRENTSLQGMPGETPLQIQHIPARR